jgi:1-aminocyclopropane-1-carboxylate deaminase/D-cysteine desulfhydrase-like pyridoxal-dependent ACC family enzyme
MSTPVLTPAQVRQAVERLPRVRLAHLPTPLEEAPRFSQALRGPRVFLKRDDCTGLLLGGNKARQNEFIFGDARAQGADMFVWGFAEQSNNTRQTAAACAKLGLECRLYLSRGRTGGKPQGNLLLDYLVGARVELVNTKMGPEHNAYLAARAAEFRAAGRKPYCYDRDHCQPVAAVGYVLALAEMMEQFQAQRLEPAAVYVCSAGPTGAGLALGKALLGLRCPVRLISPIVWPWNVPENLATVANRAAELLGLPHRLTPADLDYTEEHIGEGYAVATPGSNEAIKLLATREGVLLDPVYSAKAMAGLIADVRRGRFKSGETVVFVHTGGTPAVFALADEVFAACT